MVEHLRIAEFAVAKSVVIFAAAHAERTSGNKEKVKFRNKRTLYAVDRMTLF